jgi:hydrogenase expression/formation protein HypC
MCLAVPGKILSIVGDNLERTGEVSFGGVLREVALGYVPEAVVGDYVVVHAGCAIGLLDEEAARESLDALAQWSAMENPAR